MSRHARDGVFELLGLDHRGKMLSDQIGLLAIGQEGQLFGRQSAAFAKSLEQGPEVVLALPRALLLQECLEVWRHLGKQRVEG